MVQEEKRIKKTVSRKKAVRGEIEIPIQIIGQGDIDRLSDSRGGEMAPKIMYEKDSLPTLEEKMYGENLEEKETVEILKGLKEKARKEKEAPSLSSPVIARAVSEGWSLAKKKMIMWFSVIGITALIFFVWVFVLMNNLNFNFGSQSFSFSRSESGGFENVSAEDISIIEQLNGNIDQSANVSSTLEDDILKKMKDKVLIEDLKNRIENGNQPSQK